MFIVFSARKAVDELPVSEFSRGDKGRKYLPVSPPSAAPTSICDRKQPTGGKISYQCWENHCSWFSGILAHCRRQGLVDQALSWQWECGKKAIHIITDQDAKREAGMKGLVG